MAHFWLLSEGSESVVGASSHEQQELPCCPPEPHVARAKIGGSAGLETKYVHNVVRDYRMLSKERPEAKRHGMSRWGAVDIVHTAFTRAELAVLKLSMICSYFVYNSKYLHHIFVITYFVQFYFADEHF